MEDRPKYRGELTSGGSQRTGLAASIPKVTQVQQAWNSMDVGTGSFTDTWQFLGCPLERLWL